MDAHGNYKYQLAYRYPDIQGHNADFRLAHEMGHLMLNPSNLIMQTLDKDSNTRHVSGFIRQTPDGNFYGKEMQENAINLIAQLAIRGVHSADDIIKGKVYVSEFNSYKKSDALVRLLAVAMRNDYSKQINFEQLMEQKIDSMIKHYDTTTEPSNTFFYGILHDASIIQKDFDKYMGEGAWKDLDTLFSHLQDPNISQDSFQIIYEKTENMIMNFANSRMKYKYKEALARGENGVPSLEEKIDMLNEIAQTKQFICVEAEPEFSEGYKINEYGEIIRFENSEAQVNENKLSLKQKPAQFMQRSNVLMRMSFVEKFVNRQLNMLPSAIVQSNFNPKDSRESFINSLSNNVRCGNLPRTPDSERTERNYQVDEHDAR